LKKSYHPLLFAIFPALSLFVNNIAQVRTRDLTGTFLILLAATLLVWGGINLLIENWNKSAILVSVLLILFFSFGHVQQSLNYIFTKGGVESVLGKDQREQVVLMVVSVLLFGTTAYLVMKIQGDLSRVVGFMNAFSLIVLLIIGANWSYNFVTTPREAIREYVDAWQKGELEEIQQVQTRQSNPGNSRQNLPDIYYIVLDEYGRSDVLADLYDYDNSGFLEFLKADGFYIAEESTANYNFTWLSLSSSLNFMYLDGLTERIGTETRYSLPLEIMIEKNRLFSVLRDYGYKIVSFASEDWGVNITSSDIYLNPSQAGFNAFQNELYNTTPLPALFSLLSIKNQYDLHRERVLYTLEQLPRATVGLEGPVFVFAHVMAPHPPFVFGPNGEAIEPDYPFSLVDGTNYLVMSSRESYLEGYRGQATFISTRVEQTVKEILEDSARPPIIVLQGDHGPGSMFDFSSLENSNLHERMSILNAYYFPDQNYSSLYPDITPVNTYRVVLKKLGLLNLPILQDRNNFVTLIKPYDFIDVTASIRGN
jgi:hypothetical protein